MMEFIIPAAIIICIVEGVPLLKKRQLRELATFGFLIGIAVFLGIEKKLGMPTPFELLDQLLRPLGKTVLRYH